MEDIKTNKTLVNVVLDRSGSMSATRAGTISGYNEYINGLRAAKDTEYSVSLIEFDMDGDAPDLTIKYVDKPLADVPLLTEADYEPRGMTPLYDAIGECIRRVGTESRLVITVIITDGQENSSREFTLETIKALIKEKTDKEHWTFAFLGANIDSFAVGGSMGIAATTTSNYSYGHEQAVYANLASSTIARSALASTMGVKRASASAMFSDDQRVAMGDPTVHQKPPKTGKTSVGGVPLRFPRFRGWPARGFRVVNEETGKSAAKLQQLPTSNYLSPSDAAVQLGVTPQTVYSWMRSKKLPAKQIGRTWRIRREDLP